MNFANIDNWTYLLPITIALLTFFIFYIWWRRHALFIIFKGRNPQSVLPGKGRVIKEALLIIAIFLAAFIYLRPRWGEQIREVHKEGADLLIALDVSRSMLAQDVKPSRLQRVKDAIRILAEAARGDRIGLVLFAGNAFLQCPFTTDLGAFMMFLEGADPSSIALQGTNISAALKEADRIFTKKSINNKVLLLITDGEDHQGDIENTLDKLKEKEVIVYTAGIGDEKGSLIPLASEKNSGDIYMRDMDGKLVRSRTDVPLLKKIASETNGEYIDLTSNLSGIYKMIKVLSKEKKTDFGARLIKEPKEQYQIFTLVLIAILLLELFISERRKGHA